MASRPKRKVGKEGEEPKRLNRTVGLSEAIKGALDPAMKKRGFASRDILTHWAAMAPAPYDKVAIPDRLSWPRGDRGAEGATLYLRCAAGHQLALAHEVNRIAQSVNRYFGYLLVAQCRLSAEPFSPYSAALPQAPPISAPVRRAIEAEVGKVADDGVRDALRQLGEALKSRKPGRKPGITGS
jgi:hypothetical protein